MTKRATVSGVFLSLATEAEVAEMHIAVNKALSSGSLKLTVSAAYPLAEAATAHKLIIAPASGATGKIVLHPW